jgi:electron transfer flavoprotein beta subunit
MKLIVCVKPIPDPTKVYIHRRTGALTIKDAPTIINPLDKYAIEFALKLKSSTHSIVKEVVTLALALSDPDGAKFVLRETLAMGVDNAILLQDSRFEGADSFTTAYTLASAIKKLAPYALIICGAFAIDDYGTQVGSHIAETLKLPHATFVRKATLHRDKVEVEKVLPTGYAILELPYPSLLTVIGEPGAPYGSIPIYPTAWGVHDAYQVKPLEIWNAQDLGVDVDKVGGQASIVQLKTAVEPPTGGKCELIVDGTVDDKVSQLIRWLQGRKFI